MASPELTRIDQVAARLDQATLMLDGLNQHKLAWTNRASSSLAHIMAGG